MCDVWRGKEGGGGGGFQLPGQRTIKVVDANVKEREWG